MTLPLAGLKVLDFSTVVLAPVSTRHLADHGADVLRVESASHPDTIRTSPPYVGPPGTIDGSGYFALYSAGKRSLALNLRDPRAQHLARRLATEWADVVIESYTPRIMRGWGLDYATLSALKPDLIMVSTCLQGQTGPHAAYRGYGQLPAALVGWYELTGWPDREPTGPYSAYSDFIDWGYLLSALLAALDHRRRSGQGQHLDQSQYESAIQFAAPAVLEAAAHGHAPGRQGNRDPACAPHGAYPCRPRPDDTDRWCAIAVTSDREWVALVAAMGRPAWALEARFGTLLGRKAHEDALDERLAAWTRGWEAHALMAHLQAAGVPAGVVQDAVDLFADPQFAARGQLAPLDHPVIGRHHVPTASFRLSATPGRVERPAPLLGEHTFAVCTDILGLSPEAIAELIGAGVLE